MEKRDDFEKRRMHLTSLSEKELEEKFWDLASKLVDPMIDLANKNTSPSIERSVLLRMGFSSIEAKGIVDHCESKDLLRKGAGNVVLKYSKATNIDYLEAGRKLADGEGWDQVEGLFERGNS